MSTVPPGWYPDPAAPESGSMRWWSGEAWTDHVQAPRVPVEFPASPAEPAYVPFSASNSHGAMQLDETPQKRRVSPVFLGVAAALVVALGAGAFFGIPALFGQTGPLAGEMHFVPLPTPTPVAAGVDLGATVAPVGTHAVPPTSAIPTDDNATSEIARESEGVVKENNSIADCNALWYGAPLGADDTTSTDPVQHLATYAGDHVVISAIARQYPTVEAATNDQLKMLRLAAECQKGYTNSLGTISMEGMSAAFKPASSVGWISKVAPASRSKGIAVEFHFVEERVANRSVRVVCVEDPHKAAAAGPCLAELASVSRLLAQATGTPVK